LRQPSPMACMLKSTQHYRGVDRSAKYTRILMICPNISSECLSAIVCMQLPARERNAGVVTMGANRKFFLSDVSLFYQWWEAGRWELYELYIRQLLMLYGCSLIQCQHTHLTMLIELKITTVTAQNSHDNHDLPNAL
jgi:hypothetical protein